MTALAVARFDAEGAFLQARRRALADGHRIAGEWTPCASEPLGGADGTRGILGATIVAGALGGLALFGLEAWSAVSAYAFDAGGRPLFSWPAFVPAPIEFAALAGATGGLAAFFVRAGLTRLHHPAFDIDEVAEAALGGFVLALTCDAGADANAALAALAQAGATHTRVITP